MLPAYILAVMMAGSSMSAQHKQYYWGVQYERKCHMDRAELQASLDKADKRGKRKLVAVCLVVTQGERV